MEPKSNTTTALEALVSLLDLEKLEENLFRGRSPSYGWQRWRVFSVCSIAVWFID